MCFEVPTLVTPNVPGGKGNGSIENNVNDDEDLGIMDIDENDEPGK